MKAKTLLALAALATLAVAGMKLHSLLVSVGLEG